MKATKRICAASLAWIMASCLMAGGCGYSGTQVIPESTGMPSPTEPAKQWETGYISSRNPEAGYCDAEGNPLGTLLRGARVEYWIGPDGATEILLDGRTV